MIDSIRLCIMPYHHYSTINNIGVGYVNTEAHNKRTTSIEQRENENKNEVTVINAIYIYIPLTGKHQ